MDLLLSILIVMGMTFLIGFIVAGVIWLIAFWAERLEFVSTHQEELKRLRRIRTLYSPRPRMGWGFFSPLRKGDTDYDLGNYYQGVDDRQMVVDKGGKFYSETSPGVSDLGLMDFYYPSDTKLRILEHQKDEEEELNRTGPGKSKH